MADNESKANVNYEKEVDSFAKTTLKEVENKSKMLGIAVNQIGEVMQMRKWH